MNEHIISRFEEELGKLRSRLISIGMLVQKQLENVTIALNSTNNELIDQIILNDDKINKLDVKIDKQCFRLLALHQPVATDLRYVMTAIPINDSFEIIGDLIVDIAKSIKNSKTINNMPFNIIDKTKIKEICEYTNNIVGMVVDAYNNYNISRAIEAISLKSKIRLIHKENFTLLINISKDDTDMIEICADLISIDKDLKYISDHALSIAQEIVFLINATNIKHSIGLYDQ